MRKDLIFTGSRGCGGYVRRRTLPGHEPAAIEGGGHTCPGGPFPGQPGLADAA